MDVYSRLFQALAQQNLNKLEQECIQILDNPLCRL